MTEVRAAFLLDEEAADRALVAFLATIREPSVVGTTLLAGLA